MMSVEATATVAATPAQVRAAVLEPAAYASETKVAQVEVIERGDATLLARLHGHLGPVRSSILARYDITDERIDLTMLEGRLRGFHAVFLVEPAGEGRTRLTHREEYDFGYGLAGPLLDRLLRGWALRSVVAEVRSLQRFAEAGAAALPG